MADYDPPITLVTNSFLVSDMLQAAYRMARVLKHAGQGLSPEQTVEGVQTLNSMVDGWKIERLLMLYVRRSEQPLTVNQGSYAIGPGPQFDWDIERPEKILRASFLVQNSGGKTSELFMEIVWTDAQWQGVIVKKITSTYPLALYYIKAVAGGAGQVLLWPVPNQAGNVAIYTPQTLSEFSTEEDAVEMPDGYREMLQYNLAVKIHELYPEYAMDSNIANRADFFKQRVMASRITPMYIGSDEAALGDQGYGRGDNGLPRTWVPPWY
jgi:hypothetical protein